MVYIQKSELGGLGVFTSDFIKKGQLVLTWTGKIVEITSFPFDEEDYPIQISPTTYLNPDEPGRYVNHCCNPNSGVFESIHLIALRDIHKEEEITFDYSTTMMENGKWTLQCNCNSSECRKIIKDFKELPRNLQQKYLDLKVVSNFIVGVNNNA